METLRYALRALFKAPGFALVVVLALALGIGANSAIFSIVHAIFLRPLPYANPDTLVQVTSSIPEREFNGIQMSKPRLDLIRERQDVFGTTSVTTQTGFTITGEGDPEQTQGMQVSHEFFPLLGVNPRLGRWFTPEEDRAGGELVAMISHALWERRFGASPDVIGKPITLDGRPHTIIGVMPRSISRFPMQNVNVWTARPFEVPFLVPAQIEGGGFYFNVLGRLKPGVSIEQARKQVAGIAQTYAQQFPKNTDAKATADVNFLIDDLVGNQTETYALLFAAVGCLLLIACANVANLVLARYASRRKQVAIRFALGAKRRHVIAQFIAENVVLALAGGALGLLLAYGAIKLVGVVGENFVPRAAELSLSPAVFAFTLGVSLLTGLALGLIPALQVAKPQLTEALKDSGRDSTGGRQQNRIRSALLVGEVAVSFVLLIAASLLITSFVRVQSVEPGFEHEGVFTGFVQVPATQYPDNSEALSNYYRRLLEGLAAIPGVESASLNDSPPLTGGGPAPFAVVGKPIPPLGEQQDALRHVASPNAFATLGIPIVRGRDFDPNDTPTSPPTIIVNETLAKLAFPGEDPIGRELVTGMAQRQTTIIGVVADTYSQNLTTPPRPEMWHPVFMRPEGFQSIQLKTKGDPTALAASVRAVMKQVDPGIALVNPTTLETLVEQSTADRRLTMTLLAAFAAVALVLASLGVYSVMSYSVGQRAGEIGVRMAMGARPRDVQSLVVRQGLTLTGVGVVLGAVAALLLTRLMATLLFGVGTSDPVTYVGITALLAIVAALACFVPARRAARVDPMVVVRST